MADNVEVKHANPVGTLKELSKYGLSPAAYGSCSEPERGADRRLKNIGCPFHDLCVFDGRPEAGKGAGGKFRNFKNHGGPERIPVRVIKQNGDTVEVAMDCFMFMRKYQEMMELGTQNSDIIEALDGDKWLWHGTKPEVREDQGRRFTIHKDASEEQFVEPFVRIGDNPDLVQAAYGSEARKRAVSEAAKRSKHARLGIFEGKQAPDEPEATDGEA